MRKLHLIGLTTERDGLIFAARKGSKSGGFVVPLDDKVLEVIAEARRASDGEATADVPEAATERRGPPAQSALTPREMQARLRAGRSIEEVAGEAGVDTEWVARFAVPILAEQAQVVELARSLTYSKPRLGESSLALGPSVVQNLTDRGVFLPDDVIDAGWTAFQLHDSVWMVRFRYRARGRDHEAHWEVDVPTGRLLSRNRHASDLGFVDANRRARAIEAAVADDGLLLDEAPVERKARRGTRRPPPAGPAPATPSATRPTASAPTRPPASQRPRRPRSSGAGVAPALPRPAGRTSAKATKATATATPRAGARRPSSAAKAAPTASRPAAGAAARRTNGSKAPAAGRAAAKAPASPRRVAGKASSRRAKAAASPTRPAAKAAGSRRAKAPASPTRPAGKAGGRRAEPGAPPVAAAAKAAGRRSEPAAAPARPAATSASRRAQGKSSTRRRAAKATPAEGAPAGPTPPTAAAGVRAAVARVSAARVTASMASATRAPWAGVVRQPPARSGRPAAAGWPVGNGAQPERSSRGRPSPGDLASVRPQALADAPKLVFSPRPLPSGRLPDDEPPRPTTIRISASRPAREPKPGGEKATGKVRRRLRPR